jgi:hypothetical protein
MSDLRKFYCTTPEDLPELETVRKELELHDRIRIDYDIHADAAFAARILDHVEMIKQQLNVEVWDGYLGEVAFYNIFRLYTEAELPAIAAEVEVAAKSYRNICEELIKAFEDKYGHSFVDPEKYIYHISERMDADNDMLSDDWRYRFHGGDVCFHHLETGQAVDVKLRYNGHYGVLYDWCLQYFMKTTPEFQSLVLNFADNEPKLWQAFGYLKEQGKMKVLELDWKDREIMIWDNTLP